MRHAAYNMIASPFADPPASPWALGTSETHVWLARLDISPESARRCEAILSADEREKAARFRFERDRKHYIATRCILRQLLGRYLGAAPEKLEFNYNPHGKPSLAMPGARLRFNLSHSHGLALFGLTLDREIGVDIERLRPDFATMEIAERFFSPAEATALRSLPEELRAAAFFNCWTRKEAFIKAKGMGVFLGLHTFAVALHPDEPVALLSAKDDPEASQHWTLWALEPAADYVAAVAVEGKGLALKCGTWKHNA